MATDERMALQNEGDSSVTGNESEDQEPSPKQVEISPPGETMATQEVTENELGTDEDQEPSPKQQRISPPEEVMIPQQAPVHRPRKGKPSRRLQSSRQNSMAPSPAHRGFELGSHPTGMLSPPTRGFSSAGVQASHTHYATAPTGKLSPYTATSCTHHNEILQKLDMLTFMVKNVDSRLLTVLSNLDVIKNAQYPTPGQPAPVAPAQHSFSPASFGSLQPQMSAPLVEHTTTPVPLSLASDEQFLTQALTSIEQPLVTTPLSTAGELLSAEEIERLRGGSTSRMNFASKLNRQLFSVLERRQCNVRGRQGKGQLDPEKVEYIKEVTFRMYPLEEDETERMAWNACIVAIDESNRRLNKLKH